MKSNFPDFKGKKIEEVKIKSSDNKIIDKFITDVRGSAGEKRTKNIRRIIIQISFISEIGLDKWDYDTLSSFLAVLNKSKRMESSKNDIKKILKRFLKYYYDDWNIRFKGFKTPSIKQKPEINKEKRGKDKLLSPEQFEKLVSGCDRFMYQALFSLAYQSAGRPTELLRLKWKDLDFNNKRVKLNRYKTGNVSTLPLENLNYLENHFNNYIYPNPKQDDYIFVSPENRENHITLQTATSFLRTLGKKTIGREDLYLYVFRHTRLNSLRKILSPDMYEMFADHSLEVGMKMYGHNDNEDLEAEMYDRVFSKQVLSPKEKDEIKELRKEIDFLKNNMEKIMTKSLTKLKDKFLEEFEKEVRNSH